MNVLLIDDDRAFATLAEAALRREGYTVTTAHALHGARTAIRARDFDIVLLDRRLPDGDGMDYLPELLRAQPRAAVVMVTADDDVAHVVEALRIGAKDYVVKPVEMGDLLFKARRAADERNLRERLDRAEDELLSRHRLVPPRSPRMREVVELLERLSRRPRSPVLLLGETGVGKEVLARHLHALGHAQDDAPFVHLNCAAIGEQVAESELFGHEKGAFTDARATRRGLVELASGGTLFLDEIGELTPPLQAKLLTFLDSGEFRRLGGGETRSSTARIVAATNRDLEAEIARGAFRADLWFRLSVFQVRIPPLRERREDLPELAEAMLAKLRREMGRSALTLSPRALERLAAAPFPGNVRELRNAIERAVVMEPGPELTLEFLERERPRAPVSESERFTVEGPPLTLDQLQDRYAAHVLARLGGKRLETAQALGISYPTLVRRIGGGMKEN